MSDHAVNDSKREVAVVIENRCHLKSMDDRLMSRSSVEIDGEE